MADYIKVLQVDESGNAVASTLFKAYSALMSQAGTAAPVPTVLQNNFSAPIVWTRSGVGVYVGTLTGVFTSGKTFFAVTVNADARVAHAVRTSANVVTLTMLDNAGDAQDVFTDLSFEVRVYN